MGRADSSCKDNQNHKVQALQGQPVIKLSLVTHKDRLDVKGMKGVGLVDIIHNRLYQS